MQYVCSICNTKKNSKEEKKYVYASSTKAVRILVCKSCHQAKLAEMDTASRNILGPGAVTGVLRVPQDNNGE